MSAGGARVHETRSPRGRGQGRRAVAGRRLGG